MKYRKILAGFAIIAGVAFSGCSGIPDCDDSDVKNLLTQIAKDNRWVSKDSKLRYDAFITQFKDKDTKQISCKARVTINGLKTSYVTYTAQYTDDGQLYVEAMMD